MKFPDKLPSPKGKDCKCLAYYSNDCACGADWTDNDRWNDAIDEFKKLNPESGLVELDASNFPISDIQRICNVGVSKAMQVRDLICQRFGSKRLPTVEEIVGIIKGHEFDSEKEHKHFIMPDAYIKIAEAIHAEMSKEANP